MYIRCRLDIPYPILEVAREPAAGHGVTIGPLRGRRLVGELVEQLESLFGLRHCGRALPRRTHPSAYGQMGRCLSPCLGDLDPNLYRRRLDGALAAFLQPDGTAAAQLIAHVETQMRAAAAEQRYERAAGCAAGPVGCGSSSSGWRGGPGQPRPAASGVRARIRPGRAATCSGSSADGWWIGVRGRQRQSELVSRTERALRHASRAGDTGAHVPPGEIDEVRLVGTYLLSHPDLPQLSLPAPEAALVALAGPDGPAQVNGSSVTVARTCGLTGLELGAGRGLPADERQGDRPEARRHGGATHPAEHPLGEPELITSRERFLAEQPDQPPVRLAPVVQPGDRLLADSTPW